MGAGYEPKKEKELCPRLAKEVGDFPGDEVPVIEGLKWEESGCVCVKYLSGLPLAISK